MRRHILSFLVENQAGVMSRISGLFSRRGYNMESITVGVCEKRGYSRMTIVTLGDEQIIKQMIRQIEKLVDVTQVVELTSEKSVYRELALIKIKVTADKRTEVVGMVDIFRGNIIDVSPKSITVEITGDYTKIDAFLELCDPYGVMEIARTGLTALQRGPGAIGDLPLSKLHENVAGCK